MQGTLNHGREWVVVADAARVLVFEKGRERSLSLVKAFENPAAHLRVSDMEGDQPGRVFASNSKSHGGHQGAAPRHSYASEEDPKQHALEKFAKELARYLEQARTEKQFERLTLIAEDRFLGRLRSEFGRPLEALVAHTHAKDFAWLEGHALEERIRQLLG